MRVREPPVVTCEFYTLPGILFVWFLTLMSLMNANMNAIREDLSLELHALQVHVELLEQQCNISSSTSTSSSASTSPWMNEKGLRTQTAAADANEEVGDDDNQEKTGITQATLLLWLIYGTYLFSFGGMMLWWLWKTYCHNQVDDDHHVDDNVTLSFPEPNAAAFATSSSSYDTLNAIPYQFRGM